MRVAVIGAGIVGVTTAFELARDGHEVTVFERRSSVAEETSFANAGVVAPGYVTPWAAPGMPAKVLRHLLQRHAPVRFGGWPDASTRRWLRRWWRECAPARYAHNRSRLHRLALYSQQRLHALTHELGLDYEQSRGYLVLLRGAREVDAAQPVLSLLGELGVRHAVLDRAGCLDVEPGLSAATSLAAGIHLPDDGVGNCRQFAHLLRQQAQRDGVSWHFGCEVLRVEPGAPRAQLQLRRLGPAGPGPVQTLHFDAVVLCAALGALPLLARLGLDLPMAPVHGYSITAALRHVEGHPGLGPRSALMDERYKVAISRLGDRLRVAGSAEIGGSPERCNASAVATLHRVLHDWFPGATQSAAVRPWKAARPMLPDGPPAIGATGLDGLWVNLGHGSSGWALACGSARVLADRLAGRTGEIDADGFDPCRFRPRPARPA